jgi:hypothetical protein
MLYTVIISPDVYPALYTGGKDTNGFGENGAAIGQLLTKE